MGGTDVLAPFENELVCGPVGRVGHTPGPPLLVWLIALGAVSAYLALAGYVVIAAIDGNWSRSVLLIFGMTLLLAGGAAMVSPQRWLLLGTFGGNAAFLMLLLGWASGRVFRRAW